MGAMNTHEERAREIEALLAAISRLSAATVRIRESPVLETVLHEAMEGARLLPAAAPSRSSTRLGSRRRS